MYTILAADIGGTHCRLAQFSADDTERLTLCCAHTLDTAQVPHTAALVEAFSATGCALALADMLSVAVAGPLQDADRAQTTNATLAVDMAEARRLGARKTCLCNDFVAQAWACCSPAAAGAQMVLPGTAGERSGGDVFTSPRAVLPIRPLAVLPIRPLAVLPIRPLAVLPIRPLAVLPIRPRAVLGAGTGLGTAWLVPLPQGGYMALPAEAGHTVFPFVGTLEMSYQAFLTEKMQTLYPTADTVLSGRGLCLLHHFLTGHLCSAEEISAQHLKEESATCRWFAVFLGRMCRHWALSTLCSGGLYITGGVAGKNPVLVQCAAFAEEFFSSPTHGHFLHTVPVLLNTMADSGLWGAAWAGLRALQSGE